MSLFFCLIAGPEHPCVFFLKMGCGLACRNLGGWGALNRYVAFVFPVCSLAQMGGGEREIKRRLHTVSVVCLTRQEVVETATPMILSFAAVVFTGSITSSHLPCHFKHSNPAVQF